MRKRQNDSADTANIIKVDPCKPHPDTIESAVACLHADGLLIFPTSGLYGIGTRAFSEAAVGRVFVVKSRPAHNPLLVLIPDIHTLPKLVRSVPEQAEPLMHLWPGGLTLIFEAADTVPAVLTGGSGKIGIRLPAHPVARALTRRFGGSVTATSANVSGAPAASRVGDIDMALCRQVDMVLDAGALAGGPGSTIVDVTCRPVRVLREGAVDRRTIDATIRTGRGTRYPVTLSR
ncbi:MAG: threonylcarbamoyl-AMP synthase [Proteobacteria bacterium]|nr:MAG: threonylcarbamoyl-AMP synthase [Pseudomonadota bacterium]